jgi:hypothetical protein
VVDGAIAYGYSDMAKRVSPRRAVCRSSSVAGVVGGRVVIGGLFVVVVIGCGSKSPGSGGDFSTENTDDSGPIGNDDGGTGAPLGSPDAGHTRSDDAGDDDAGPGAAPGPEAGPPHDAGSCPSPPAGVDTQAAAAFQLLNQTRSAMGSACATMVTTLNTSAAKHCAYFAANFAMNPSFTANMCIASPHYEVMGCTDFYGTDPAAREMAAGYSLANGGGGEDMDFLGNGAAAVQDWLNSVYHRTDVLSPWTGDVGYGSASMCDTLDFGTGHTGASTSLVVTYPYDGQTGVPVSFNGGREEPTPAVPPGGWPSGYPINVYIQGATLTTHELSVDGGAQIAHQWLTPATDTNLKYANTAVLYGNAPLTAATRYLVHVAGTRGGSPIDVKFTFTTQ